MTSVTFWKKIICQAPKHKIENVDYVLNTEQQKSHGLSEYLGSHFPVKQMNRANMPLILFQGICHREQKYISGNGSAAGRLEPKDTQNLAALAITHETSSSADLLHKTVNVAPLLLHCHRPRAPYSAQYISLFETVPCSCSRCVLQNL